MENKVKKTYFRALAFYGTLAVCLLVVGCAAGSCCRTGRTLLPQQAVTPQVPVSQPVEMPEVRLPTVETLEPEPIPVPPKGRPRNCRRWRWITRLWRRKHPVWW